MKVSVEGRFQPTRIDKIGIINLPFLFECCRVQNARLPFVFFLLSKLKKFLIALIVLNLQSLGLASVDRVNSHTESE